MTQKFGDVLRAARKKADKTMLQLASELGFTVSYVSDVELGRRPPFAQDKIEQAAAFLNADVDILCQLAVGARGNKVTLNVDDRESAREVGAMLMRGFETLTDVQLEQIKRVLSSTEKA